MSARFSFPNFSCYLCLLLVLALFCFCLSVRNYDDVLCLDDERHALLQFKHGLVDEASQLASWVGDDEKSDCCKWTGIVCDNFTGHVHRIHLRGHCDDDYDNYHRYGYELRRLGLRGNLSPSLLRLKHLKHLDLSCNDFGSIQVPSFIGSLGNLRYLNLSNSMFGGTIPPQLGNLSELQVLSLGCFHDTFLTESTRIRNMQWLSSLHVLHHLDMSGVDLSEAINSLQLMNTLPSLVKLHLSGCQLSHIHSHFPSLNFTSLSVLDLSFNFLNSLMPRWIFSLTSLVSLDLSGCGFNGLNPSSIDSFRNLTSLKLFHVSHNDVMSSSLVLKGLSSSVGSNLISLNIAYCGISSSLLDDLNNLTSLHHLDMLGNEITKTIPKSLGNLCNLREINLSQMNFSNINLAHVLKSLLECKSPSLESLSIKFSRISGHLPDKLGQFINLVHLKLQGNQIIRPIPDVLGPLSFLKLLDLSMNLITGSIPYWIGELSSLKVLDLSDNNLNGSLPYSIGRLSSLVELHLSNNQLISSLPDSIGWLSSLKALDLSFNELNGSLPDSIGQLSSLEVLHISYNQMAGWLPDSIGRLSLLKMLVLSGNSLNGSLPDSIGQLSSALETLRLSDNQLHGSLPDSIGRLSSLKELDLSRNQLNGSLPYSFGQLSKLYYLDLSYNLLTGIVTEDHFAKLESLEDLYGSGNNMSLRPRNANWIPCFQLQILYLESWGLGPQFPLRLYSQRDLIQLDISSSNISAPLLPSFWRSFPKLLYLYMSKNHISGILVGIIPIKRCPICIKNILIKFLLLFLTCFHTLKILEIHEPFLVYQEFNTL